MLIRSYSHAISLDTFDSVGIVPDSLLLFTSELVAAGRGSKVAAPAPAAACCVTFAFTCEIPCQTCPPVCTVTVLVTRIRLGLEMAVWNMAVGAGGESISGVPDELVGAVLVCCSLVVRQRQVTGHGLPPTLGGMMPCFTASDQSQRIKVACLHLVRSPCICASDALVSRLNLCCEEVLQLVELFGPFGVWLQLCWCTVACTSVSVRSLGECEAYLEIVTTPR